MSIANPQQKELINSLNGKSKEERAQKIADYCNEQRNYKRTIRKYSKNVLDITVY